MPSSMLRNDASCGVVRSTVMAGLLGQSILHHQADPLKSRTAHSRQAGLRHDGAGPSQIATEDRLVSGQSTPTPVAVAGAVTAEAQHGPPGGRRFDYAPHPSRPQRARPGMHTARLRAASFPVGARDGSSGRPNDCDYERTCRRPCLPGVLESVDPTSWWVASLDRFADIGISGVEHGRADSRATPSSGLHARRCRGAAASYSPQRPRRLVDWDAKASTSQPTSHHIGD